MEMLFGFCQTCLNALDRNYTTNGEFPAYLYAYGEPKCASCDRKSKIVGTRKFAVELANVEEKDGVHQYSEFAVIRYIKESSDAIPTLD